MESLWLFLSYSDNDRVVRDDNDEIARALMKLSQIRHYYTSAGRPRYQNFCLIFTQKSMRQYFSEPFIQGFWFVGQISFRAMKTIAAVAMKSWWIKCWDSWSCKVLIGNIHLRLYRGPKKIFLPHLMMHHIVKELDQENLQNFHFHGKLHFGFVEL